MEITKTATVCLRGTGLFIMVDGILDEALGRTSLRKNE